MSAALCLFLAGGALAATVHAQAFTLSWVHSVEKVEWQEDYAVRDGRLVPLAARIKGSGAGMEPPPGAVLRDGWWHYTPELAPQEELVLARSHFTEDYRLCLAGVCRPLAELVPLPPEPTVTRLRACE